MAEKSGGGGFGWFIIGIAVGAAAVYWGPGQYQAYVQNTPAGQVRMEVEPTYVPGQWQRMARFDIEFSARKANGQNWDWPMTDPELQICIREGSELRKCYGPLDPVLAACKAKFRCTTGAIPVPNAAVHRRTQRMGRLQQARSDRRRAVRHRSNVQVSARRGERARRGQRLAATLIPEEVPHASGDEPARRSGVQMSGGMVPIICRLAGGAGDRVSYSVFRERAACSCRRDRDGRHRRGCGCVLCVRGIGDGDGGRSERSAAAGAGIGFSAAPGSRACSPLC